MSWLHPQGFWLLALVPLVWGLAWVSRNDHARGRLLGGVLLRTATLVLLVLAVCQPRLLERDRGVSVVYAVDISRSVSPSFVVQALDWIRSTTARFKPVEVRYLVFADRPRFVESLDAIPALAVSAADRSDDPGVIAQGATDLEQALMAAAAASASGTERRLVLVSDGVQTQGDLWRMLPRLQEANIRVFTVPAAVNAGHDAWLAAVGIPEGARREQPITVHVEVQSTGSTPAQVELAVGNRRLGSRQLMLHEGANGVDFDTVLREAGTLTLSATVRAQGDGYPANDTLSQSARVGPRPRVLYVEGVPESARYLSDALAVHHIDVIAAGPDALVRASVSLAGFDAVILSDLPAQSLDPRAAAALEQFVRDRGGGLIFAAGESTHGQDGFAGSALERMLPVRFEGKRKRRDLDLVLLIDRSHSMRAGKLEVAKTAALSTLDMLDPRHRLAVVAFDTRAHQVVPLAPVGNKRRAEDLISSMTAQGQTSIYPAFAEAQRLLAGSTAATRHIILLSDGITIQPPAAGPGAPTAAQIHAMIQKGREEAMRHDGIPVPRAEAPTVIPEPGAIEALVAELARAKVTVSTIAIGDKPDVGFMSDLAAIAGGRSYVARNDGEVPGLFVSETRRLLGESMVEKNFQPAVVHRTGAVAGIDFERGPPLRGMVVARPKAFADVVLRGPEQRPLFVTTHYGLGRTVAFLSDVKNRWSSDWIAWEGYGRFWAQVVRDCIQPPLDDALMLRVNRAGTEAVIELRALDSEHRFRNGLSPVVRMTDPLGARSAVALSQIAPGQYAGRRVIEAGHAAPYRFELDEGGGLTRAEVRAAGVQPLSYSWSDELRALPADVATLRELGSATGGGLASNAADIFALRGDGPRTPRPLWPYLVAAALVLFLLDIAWRRAPRLPGRRAP